MLKSCIPHSQIDSHPILPELAEQLLPCDPTRVIDGESVPFPQQMEYVRVQHEPGSHDLNFVLTPLPMRCTHDGNETRTRLVVHDALQVE